MHGHRNSVGPGWVCVWGGGGGGGNGLTTFYNRSALNAHTPSSGQRKKVSGVSRGVLRVHS